MTYLHAKVQDRQSVGFQDRVETNGRTVVVKFEGINLKFKKVHKVQKSSDPHSITKLTLGLREDTQYIQHSNQIKSDLMTKGPTGH